MTLKPDWKVGFSIGLKYWLFFMISLFMLGYDWILSISIGMVGGIAASTIAAWWYAKEDFDAPEKIPETTEAEAAPTTESSAKKTYFQRYGFWGKKRQSKARRRFGWLFRKKS